MGVQENKALARVWLDEVINGRDVKAIERAYAPSYRHRGPDGHEMDRSDAIATAEMLLASSHDRKARVITQVAEGDLVATRWESRGTLTGPLFGLEPTGQPVVAQGIVISRIAKGRIVEDWEMFDLRHEPPAESSAT